MQVNIIIESYDVLKTRFPFTKPTENMGGGGGNPWDQMYNKGGSNQNPGGGFNQNQNNWGNKQQQPASQWNQASLWGGNNNNNQINNPWANNGNNQWTQPNKGGMGGIMGGGAAMGAGMGGAMGGAMGGGPASAIASGQKLVGKQKQTLGSLNNYYANLVAKTQHLDTLKQSLESE